MGIETLIFFVFFFIAIGIMALSVKYVAWCRGTIDIVPGILKPLLILGAFIFFAVDLGLFSAIVAGLFRFLPPL